MQTSLADKEKLDNRIRNIQAGNHVRANKEGLRNEIYLKYSKTIADEALKLDELDALEYGRITYEEFLEYCHELRTVLLK